MALFMLRHGRRFPSTVRFTSVFSNKGVVLNRSSRTRLLPPSPVAVAAAAVRACSSHEQEQAKQAIKRFEVVPGPMFWIKSRIYYFLIKTFFDKDFNVKTFIEGATKAFSHVSRLLSKGQFDALEGLVAAYGSSCAQLNTTGDSLQQLQLLGPMKLNYRWMPLHERQGLAADHIMSAIPNNVEFYTDTLGRRFVDIRVHFYYLTAYDAKHNIPETHLFQVAGKEGTGVKSLRIAVYEFRMELNTKVHPHWMIITLHHSMRKPNLESKL